jgi:hypothetical protein
MRYRTMSAALVLALAVTTSQASAQPASPAPQPTAKQPVAKQPAATAKPAPATNTVPAPQAAPSGKIAAPTKMSTVPNSKRYRWDGQMWWYYHPDGKWSYWNGKGWMPTPISGQTLPGSAPHLAGVTGVNADGEAFDFNSALREVNLGDGEEGYQYQRGTNRIGENN